MQLSRVGQASGKAKHTRDSLCPERARGNQATACTAHRDAHPRFVDRPGTNIDGPDRSKPREDNLGRTIAVAEVTTDEA